MVEEESEEEEEQGAAAVGEPIAEDDGGNENDGEGEDHSDGDDEQASEEESDEEEEEQQQQQQGVSQKRRAGKTKGGRGTKQGNEGREKTSGKTVATTKKNVLPPLQVRSEFSGNTALLGRACSFVLACCLKKQGMLS